MKVRCRREASRAGGRSYPSSAEPARACVRPYRGTAQRWSRVSRPAAPQASTYATRRQRRAAHPVGCWLDSRTVPSSPAEASVVPSGLNATEFTALVWPVSGSPIGWRLDTSHSRTVPSSPAEASIVASGLNATEFTALVWPVSGSPIGWRLDTSHSRTGVPGERLADRPAAGIPQAQGAVVTGGGQQGAVMAERHRVHRAGVPGERLADRLEGGHIPQPHGARVVRGGHCQLEVAWTFC